MKKGQKHSEATLEVMRAKKKGRNHPIWKGGSKSYTWIHGEELAGRPKSESCEVCGAIGGICFDHDHATGQFRGWICRRCNLILGHAKDSPVLLRQLADYLKK